jgi:hypothetical protein
LPIDRFGKINFKSSALEYGAGGSKDPARVFILAWKQNAGCANSASKVLFAHTINSILQMRKYD